MAIRVTKTSRVHRTPTSTKQPKVTTTRRVDTRRNPNVKSKRVATRIK